jgi:hypothetical protein
MLARWVSERVGASENELVNMTPAHHAQLVEEIVSHLLFGQITYGGFQDGLDATGEASL